MAAASERRPVWLKTLTYGFVLFWFILAAFPFLWTFWGSFKVELDFFSIADWTYALTGERTKQNTAVRLQTPRTVARGFRKNSTETSSTPGSCAFLWFARR